jgi:hypothetical protein
MRSSLNAAITTAVVCSLITITHFSILAQTGRKQESPREMVDRLQREIKDMQAKLVQNSSSPEAVELKKKIQWNNRRIKEILPGVAEQDKDDAEKIERGPAEGSMGTAGKEKNAHPLGLERYMVIVQKNLFTSLGSGREVKRQKFAVTGILNSGGKRVALIQVIGEPMSYYVPEGQSFGNGAKLARVEEDKVTIIHEGNSEELKLGHGIPTSQSRSKASRGSAQRGKSSRKVDQGKKEYARREEEEWTREKKERREREEREQIEQKIHNLHQTRDKIKRKIAEMEEKGTVPHDAYEKMDAINHKIRDLESELR